MSNQTQQQIDALIQFINDAEEPGTVTNLIVAAVLVFLSDKVKTMATASALDAAVSALEAVDASLNQAIQDEVTVRQAEDTTLSDRISVLQVALDQLMSVGLISVINNLTEGGTDKALSAEMGKELGQRVESLEASDRTITYDQTTDTFSIVRSPMLSVLGNVVLSGTNKSGTFKVSGSNLKGDVTVRVSASGWKLRVGSGTKAESVTLSQTGGVLAETTVTAIYEGSADSVGNTIVVTSAGAESKTVTASYMAAPLPTISAVSSVQISAIAGGSGTAAIQVTASNLTSGITVTKSGTNASKFLFSPGSLGENGGTLTVEFYPEASDTANQSAKLTLSSAGATPVEITLTGKVQVPSLTVAPTQLNMQSESGSPATGTVNIKGSNLLNDVGLSVSGDGFSVSKSLLTAAAVNAAGNNGIDVTITRSNSATATTGTLTITSGSLTRTVTLNWEEEEAETEAVGEAVRRNVGYSSESTQSPDLWVNFKITELASGNTHGKVAADALGEPYWSTDQNFVCDRLILPETITIGEHQYDVTSLATWSFNTKNFNIFSLPLTITSIGGYSFNSDTIQKLLIPNGISTGVNLVQGNVNFESIDFGAAQNDLAGLLNKTKPLTSGIILRKTDSVVNIGSGAFASVTGPITVYVPNGLIESYKSATNWSTYFNNGKVTFAAIQENS